MTLQAEAMDWAKCGGLLPLIAQHAHDGRVLMVGCTNRDAMVRTLATGEAHFWSRSRQRIWRKGETSGHTLRVVSIVADCDCDALLCQVLPAGPTCHRGTQSCFDNDGPAHPWLNQLDALIASRAAGSEPGYVAELLSGPVARRAQKVGEEAVETALAAVSGSADALRSEAADLLFHLMVLLRGNGLSLADVAGGAREAASTQGAMKLPALPGRSVDAVGRPVATSRGFAHAVHPAAGTPTPRASAPGIA